MAEQVHVERDDLGRITATDAAKVGDVVEFEDWNGELTWMRVDRFADSEAHGPSASGPGFSDRSGAPAKYTKMRIVPLSLVAAHAAQVAKRAAQGRPECQLPGCGRSYAGVADTFEARRALGSNVEGRADGKSRLCAAHRREVLES